MAITVQADKLPPVFTEVVRRPTLPGFGRMNQAAFGYQYALTDYLEVQAGVSAIKYSFPMSVGASFGASGSLIYHPSGRFRLTASEHLPRQIVMAFIRIPMD